MTIVIVRSSSLFRSPDHLYNLKICLESLHLTSLEHRPHHRKKVDIVDKLFSEEDRLAAQLILLYDEYKRRNDGDPLDVIDGRR